VSGHAAGVAVVGGGPAQNARGQLGVIAHKGRFTPQLRVTAAKIEGRRLVNETAISGFLGLSGGFDDPIRAGTTAALKRVRV